MAGRPSSYKQEYAELAKNYCLLGATDADLAEFLGTTRQTMDKWKKDYPEFAEAVTDGKERADSLVARSLYNKAVGGDTTACIFWLKNRQKHAWRDRHEIDHSGKVAVDPIQVLLQTVEGTGLKPAD
jgi:DNA-binding XRE family transcriptional regulator